MTDRVTLTRETTAVLRSFWHRTRREYVEWLGREIIQRSGQSADCIAAAARAGMIARCGIHYSRTPVELRSYRITDDGMAFLYRHGKEN
jgi:hypothetical protein